MKIKIKEKEHIDLLNKITFILFGIFLTCLIFASILNFIPKYGVYIATSVIILLNILALKFSTKKSKIRLISITSLTTLILTIIATIIIFQIISSKLQGF